MDVRIIAATNTDLVKMCDEGLFRSDLYYRLSVFPIEIPPLRERKEDIPVLVEVFLRRLNRFNAKEIHGVHPQVMEALERYHWPGNIRELENLIERAYILETSNMLTPESFPSELFTNQPEAKEMPRVDTSRTLEEVRRQAVEEVEKRYLSELLRMNSGRIGSTAQKAGIGVRQLHKLMRKHGLRKEDFKSLGA